MPIGRGCARVGMTRLAAAFPFALSALLVKCIFGGTGYESTERPGPGSSIQHVKSDSGRLQGIKKIVELLSGREIGHIGLGFNIFEVNVCT